MDRRDEVSILARAISERAAVANRTVWIPGQVVGAPDMRTGDVEVLPDGASKTVFAQIVDEWPSVEQRVLLRFAPPAGVFVDGVVGGTNRLLGAFYSDIADLPIAGGSETSFATIEVAVLAPNRTIGITGHGLISANSGGSLGIGRVRRDGVEIGRWGMNQSTAGTNGELWDGRALDFPEVGVYTYELTIQVIGGFVLRAAASPFTMTVEDLGPAPPTIT